MPGSDTIVALSTPAGESALAVVRLSGPGCGELAGSVLGRTAPPAARRATYGQYRDQSGETVDDCVITRYAEGASFTGEPMLEIAPHGNPLIVQMILEDLLARGCRAAEPGEFSRRAFSNGRMDLSQAEGIAELIHARSERGLAVARRQMHGAVGRKMSELTDRLLHAVAEVEAYIDFPDEDLPPEDRSGPAARVKTLIGEVGELIETQRYSSLLREGVKTLIAGAPNAGKSSLINALSGTSRAIVSETPGTTRDYLSAPLMVGSWRIELLDTAGLREPGEAIERMGVANTLEQAETADFFLAVADSTRPAPPLPDRLSDRVTPANTLVLENKADLPGSAPMDPFLPECEHFRISLATGEGVPELRARWAEKLDALAPPGGVDGVVVNARHAAALERSRAALERALAKMRAGETSELAAADLREAVDGFGEVVGKVDNEAMLDRLFANFCIGK